MNLRRPCSHDRYESHYSYLDPTAWCPGGVDITHLTPLLMEAGYAGVIRIRELLNASGDGVFAVGRMMTDRDIDIDRSYVLIAMDKIEQADG